MLSIFKPAPHKARLPAAEIDPTYRRLRLADFPGDILWLCRVLSGAQELCPRDALPGRTGFFHAAIWALRCPGFPSLMVFRNL